MSNRRQNKRKAGAITPPLSTTSTTNNSNKKFVVVVDDENNNNNDWHEKCLALLQQLTCHRQASPFLAPIPEQHLAKGEVPMDLGTVATKLQNQQYCCAAAFLDDVHLVFANGLMHNTARHKASTLLHLLERHKLWRQRVECTHSSHRRLFEGGGGGGDDEKKMAAVLDHGEEEEEDDDDLKPPVIEREVSLDRSVTEVLDSNNNNNSSDNIEPKLTSTSNPKDIINNNNNKPTAEVLEAQPSTINGVIIPSDEDDDMTSNNNNTTYLSTRAQQLVDFEYSQITAHQCAHIEACGGTTTGSSRKCNQDAYILENRLAVPYTMVAGVFDGHGFQGEVAATAAANSLPYRLATLLATGVAPVSALNTAFEETNRSLLDIAKRQRHAFGYERQLDYGTTAVVCLLDHHRAYVANVGDSRCLLVTVEDEDNNNNNDDDNHDNDPNNTNFTQASTILPITVDHNPTVLREERRRVARNGGALHDTGMEIRVCPDNMTLQEARVDRLTLNMSRAMGHAVLRNHGISAVPDVYEVDLNPHKRHYLVLGSDGLFNVMNNNEVARHCVGDTHNVCMRLLTRADELWEPVNGGDNISVVVIRVDATLPRLTVGVGSGHVQRVNLGDDEDDDDEEEEDDEEVGDTAKRKKTRRSGRKK